MAQRYVWWDDIQRHARVRLDVRTPKPLAEFLQELAKAQGVTVNALVVGMLAYMADAGSRRCLVVEVVPAVRVTEGKPAGDPVALPVPAPTSATRKRWQIPKVR